MPVLYIYLLSTSLLFTATNFKLQLVACYPTIANNDSRTIILLDSKSSCRYLPPPASKPNCRKVPNRRWEAWTIVGTTSYTVHYTSLGRCRPSTLGTRSRIVPMFNHCGVRGDCKSNGGRQKAQGVTTKQSYTTTGMSGPSLLRIFGCKNI